MNRWNSIVVLVWAYIGELLLAALAAFGAWRFASPGQLKAIVVDGAGAWTVVLSAFAGLAVAALLAFYAMTQNAFGIWLRQRSSYGVYALGFSVPIAVFALAIVFLLGLKPHSAHTAALVVGIGLLSYAAVVLLTLLVNLYEFATLALKFREVEGSNKPSPP